MWVKVVSVSVIVLSIVFSGFRQLAEKNGIRFPSFDGSDLEVTTPPKLFEESCGWFKDCKHSQPLNTNLWGNWLSKTEQMKEDEPTNWYDRLKLKLQAPVWFENTEAGEQQTNQWWQSANNANNENEESKGWLSKTDPSTEKAEQRINQEPPTDALGGESITPDELVNLEKGNNDGTKSITIKIVMVPQFRNIWNKAGEMFQRMKCYSEYLSASCSAVIVFITLPYAILFVIQFANKKAVKAQLDEAFPSDKSSTKSQLFTSAEDLDKPEITSGVSETSIDEKTAFLSTDNTDVEKCVKDEAVKNSLDDAFLDDLSSTKTQPATSSDNLDKPEVTSEVSETSIDEKLALLSTDSTEAEKSTVNTGLDLEVLAQTVEYLQKKCRQKELQILKKGSELEEMARTVEYLQRPGPKRWVGIINKVPVYHSRFPAIANMRYYQFHVPVEADGRPLHTDELKIGNSEEELSAREDSDISDAESCSDLEWG